MGELISAKSYSVATFALCGFGNFVAVGIMIGGISSLAGFRGLPHNAAYCASKAGFSAMLESLRIDLLKTDIAVTTVCPGFIKTPLTANRKHNMPFLLELDDAALRLHKGMVARKRMILFPWQLASVVRTARFLPGGLYERFTARASGLNDPSGQTEP